MPGIWIQPARLPLIGGHRGASAVAAENGAEAIAAAIAAGADFVEIDVRLTADGVPVAMHDADLARMAGDPRRVADLLLSEARGLWPSMLTIPEAIALVQGRAGLLLDVKLLDKDDLHALARTLAPFAGSSVALGLRTLDAVLALDGQLPECPRLGLFRDPADYPAFALQGGTWARLWQADATPDAIARLRDHGLRVIVMTGDPTPDGVGEIGDEDLADLIARAPDALMLNDPARAVALRQSHADSNHSLVKRSIS